MASISWSGLSEGGPGADRGACLEAALTYLDRGWAVMNGPGVAWGECACRAGSRCGRGGGKHPYGGWSDRERRTLTRENALWVWNEGRIKGDIVCDNIFLVCYLSDLIVADIDDVDAFQRLVDEGQYTFPTTLTARTGSGGMHMLYRKTWDRNGPAPVVYDKLPGGAGDIRWKSVIVAAPSAHVSGGMYEWINWETPVADAPEWLAAEQVNLIQAAPEHLRNIPTQMGMWTEQQISVWTADAAGLGRLVIDAQSRGKRANRPGVTYAVALRGGQLVAWGLLPQEYVEKKLLDSAMENGWLSEKGEAEVLRQIRNGIARGVALAHGDEG